MDGGEEQERVDSNPAPRIGVAQASRCGKEGQPGTFISFQHIICLTNAFSACRRPSTVWRHLSGTGTSRSSSTTMRTPKGFLCESRQQPSFLWTQKQCRLRR